MHHSTWGTQVQPHLLKAEVVEAQTQGQLLAAAELPAVLRTPAVAAAEFPSEWRIPAELPAVLRTPVVAVAVCQPKLRPLCEWRIPEEAVAAVPSPRIQQIWIGPESATGQTVQLQVDGPRNSSAASRSDRRARRWCEQSHSENSLPPPCWWLEHWGTSLHPKR